MLVRLPQSFAIVFRRRHISIPLCLAAYLAGSLIAGLHLGHDHSHDRPVLTNSPETVAANCCCEHHHPGDGETEETPHRHPHPHEDHDDCRICQFLAEKPLPVVVVAIVDCGRTIEVYRVADVQYPDATRPALPFSRAPPALA